MNPFYRVSIFAFGTIIGSFTPSVIEGILIGAIICIVFGIVGYFYEKEQRRKRK